MRPTKQIDDPRWDDITDRDALIRKLCHIVGRQFEMMDRRPNTVLILDSLDDALNAIGDVEDDPLPTREELRADNEAYDEAVMLRDPQGGYCGSL